jgi:hypothetical protein
VERQNNPFDSMVKQVRAAAIGRFQPVAKDRKRPKAVKSLNACSTDKEWDSLNFRLAHYSPIIWQNTVLELGAFQCLIQSKHQVVAFNLEFSVVLKAYIQIHQVIVFGLQAAR